jgi:tetratricopeptide (TPR) repeat protein
MGLFDRFKLSNAPTQKGLTAKEWCDKGDALAKSGREEEALQCFDKALAIDPKDAKAWALKGATLGMLSRHQEALQCLDKALELDPRDVDAWNYRGAALDMLDRHQEALQCFDKALAIDPTNAPHNKGNRWHLRKFVKPRPRSSEEKELVSMLPLRWLG